MTKLLSLWLVLFLCACTLEGTSQTPEIVQSETPTPTLTPTEPATTTPTVTLTPTVTATATPTPTPTPVFKVQPITVENAHLLTNLTSSGFGDLLNIQLSPDNSTIILGTTHGVLFLDPRDYSQKAFLPMLEKATDVYFTKNGKKIVAGNINNGLRTSQNPRRMIYIWDYPSLELLETITFTCPIPRDYLGACFFYPSQDFDFAYFAPFRYVYAGGRSHREFDIGDSFRVSKAGETSLTLENPVLHVAFSPDGTRSIQVTTNGFSIMDESSQSNVQVVQEPKITYAQFLDDEKFILFRQNLIEFWAFGQDSPYSSIRTQDLETEDVFIADNKLFVHSDSIVYVINYQTGVLVQSLGGGKVSYFQDTQDLFVDTRNGLINQFGFNEEKDSFEFRTSFPGHSVEVSNKVMIMSSDRTQFMVNGFEYKNHDYIYTDKILTYNLITQKQIASFTCCKHGLIEPSEIFDGIWNPSNNRFLLLNGQLGMILEEFDLANWKIIELSEGIELSRGTNSYGAAISPDSEHFAFFMGTDLYLWDLIRNVLHYVDRFAVTEHSLFSPRFVIFSRAGDILGVRTETGEIRYYQINDLKRIRAVLPFPPEYDGQLKKFFNPDAEKFHFDIRQTSVGHILQFDLVNNETGQRFPVNCGYSCNTSFNRENALMAIGKMTSWGGQFEVIDPLTNSSLFWSGPNYSNGRTSVFLSPDSRYLIVWPGGSFPQLWGVPDD